MGREVRMVPKDWIHPKDRNGKYIPLFDCLDYNQDEIEEGLSDDQKIMIKVEVEKNG